MKKIFYRIFCSSTFLMCLQGAAVAQKGTRPNILLIVADDMNYNATGVFGCPVPGTTPNIDQLGNEGIRFTNAHVTIGVCQPSRGAIMMGMYGMHSGVEGFEHYFGNQPTLTEKLREGGYLTGMLSKVKHSMPKFETELGKFDMVKGLSLEMGFGRNPQKYYEFAKSFFTKAKKEHRPFFMMANSRDPHRPFAGSADEMKFPQFAEAAKKGLVSTPSKIFTPDEIVVPGFLPDLPDIRNEIAQYYSSVRRCDDTVGAILKALKESGQEDNTLIVFISDNGMAFPFAKTNCYLNSTKTPFIAKWTGHIRAGAVDTTNFISGIDFMPTFLDVTGISGPGNLDGKSFLPLLKGQTQDGRDKVFTQFFETAAKARYPMRAVQNKQFGYIFNPWSDDSTVFRNESMSGLTFNAMKKAAVTDKYIDKRTHLLLYRVIEEFYDFRNDPNALNNLIDDPVYRDEIQEMRDAMHNWMIRVHDPAEEAFEHRYSRDFIEHFKEKDNENAVKRRKEKADLLKDPAESKGD